AAPAFLPESQWPPTQRGHGASALPVAYARAETPAENVAVPARRSKSAHAPCWKAFTMQLDASGNVGAGIGSGGPKKQRASDPHAPSAASAPQSASVAHAPWPSVPALPLRQWWPEPAGSVQSCGPDPGPG